MKYPYQLGVNVDKNKPCHMAEMAVLDLFTTMSNMVRWALPWPKRISIDRFRKILKCDLGPVSSKCLRQDFVLENVPGRFKDKSRVSSNSRNLGSSQILS